MCLGPVTIGGPCLLIFYSGREYRSGYGSMSIWGVPFRTLCLGVLLVLVLYWWPWVFTYKTAPFHLPFHPTSPLTQLVSLESICNYSLSRIYSLPLESLCSSSLSSLLSSLLLCSYPLRQWSVSTPSHPVAILILINFPSCLLYLTDISKCSGRS